MNEEEITSLLLDYDAEILLYSKGKEYRLRKASTTNNKEEGYLFEEGASGEAYYAKDIYSLYQGSIQGMRIQDILESNSNILSE